MRTSVFAAAVAALVVTGVAGAVAPRKPNLTAAAQHLTEAIDREEVAIARLQAGSISVGDHLISQSKLQLKAVLTSLSHAAFFAELPDVDNAQIRSAVNDATTADSLAQSFVIQSKAARAIAQLRRAIQAKRRAQTQILGFVTADTRTTCNSAKQFPVYAPGNGASGVWNDVFVHNVPTNATDIRVTLIDVATHTTPAPGAFGPGLTWNVEPGVFTQHDGQTVYKVRVNVLGQGSGPTDANHRDWVVTVTWRC